MRHALGALLIGWLALWLTAPPSRSADPDVKQPEKVKETISGRSFRAIQVASTENVKKTISLESFRAIQAALPALERYGIDVKHHLFDGYIISASQGSEVVVAFINPEHALRPPNVPPPVGCLGPRPCLVVRLDAATLRIIRSNLVL